MNLLIKPSVTPLRGLLSLQPSRSVSRRWRSLRVTCHFTALLAALLAIAAPGSGRAQIIDTATEWLATGASTYSAPFGEPAFAAWGQTFVAPTGFTRLNTFSVWLQSGNESSAMDDVDFSGEVFEWSDTGLVLVGQKLYGDVHKRVAHADPAPPFEELVFDIGVVLDPAKKYMFFAGR